MASLGNDLAHIRKEQNLSLDDIHQATKIPKRILVSIEDDSIFSNFEENPTYIRSYIRSYAKALSIDDEQIVFALNNKQTTDYKGSLQNLSETKDKEPLQFDEEHESFDEADEPRQMHHDHSPEHQSSNPEEQKDPDEETNSQPQSPNVRSVDWADMGRQFQPLKSIKSNFWVGIAAIILVAVLGSYLLFYQFGVGSANNSQQSVQNQEMANTEMTSDSLQLNITPSATEDSIQPTTESASTIQNNGVQDNDSMGTLPDTLDIVLYAAYGKLEPVRVFTDVMSNTNPYWLEEGEAIRFNFVNELRIRERTDNFVLLLNGRPIQNVREQFYNPDTRLFEVNRSFFEGDSKWLQSAPDTLAIDAPLPSDIQNRPTFN